MQTAVTKRAPTARAERWKALPVCVVGADFQFLPSSFQGPFWAPLPQNDLNCQLLSPAGHHILHEFFHSFVVFKTGGEI